MSTTMRFKSLLGMVCALLLWSAASARAATFTVTNTGDTGRGSLRVAITNANSTAGADTIAFNIPTSDGGYNATTGVFTIAPATALPALTEAVTIDGTTQTTNVGNTNAGTLGVGGSVGVQGVALGTVNQPEISLVGTNAVAVGLDVQASGVTLRGLDIYGFGNGANNNANANIRIGDGFTVTLIEQNVIGSSATSFTDPGAGARTNADNIRSVGGDSGTIRNNLIGFGAGKGIGLEVTSTGWSISGNEIRGNGIGHSNLDGIDIENSSGSETITGNLILAQEGVGIDSYQGAGGNTITNNTVTGNGRGDNNSAATETAGMRMFGTGTRIELNIISGNYGAGVQIVSSASSNVITRNSIFNNGTVSSFGGAASSGQIGIDLNSSSDALIAGTTPFVTLNDSGDADTGGNGLLNFPVITAATLGSGNLTLEGFARPGTVIELFIAAPDPRGFGEGQTYLTALTEGGAGDTDATTGTYSGIINGQNQGTDTTNRFRFVVAAPSGVSVGTSLTATGTLGGATSEFSGNAPVVAGGSVSGFVYLDANASSARDTGENGTGVTGLFVKLVPTAGGNAIAAAAVDATTGAYNFAGIVAGNYNLVLDNNSTLSDVTPFMPAGYLGTEAAAGLRAITANGTALLNQNFGLFNGSVLTGRVFADNGAGTGGVANDGVQNGSEAGAGGIVVNAQNTAGTTTYATATTDASGNYTLYIPASASGTVVVKPVLSAGLLSTGGSAGTTGGTYARSGPTVSFTFTAGTSYSGVVFGEVPANTFTNDGAKTAIAGTVVYYPHAYTANSAGSVSFATSSDPNPSSVTGYTQAVFQDTNGNGVLDAGEPQITAPVALVAGQVLNILVRETVPATAPAGAKDVVTTSATFTYSNATPALSSVLTRTDTTTSAASGLELIKAVDKTTAKRGDVLTYTVTYRNISGENLAALRITDTVPAFTTYTSAAFGTTPAGLTNGTITAPAAGAAGNVLWTFTGSLAPNASGTVTLRVTLQ